MINSYIKLAIRNLVRNKLTSFINIVGLSVAIGGCIFVFLVFNRHFTLDAFHENAEKIFTIENIISAKGENQIWGNSPVPLGPALQKDFPQIERFVRMNQQWITVRSGDNIFNESIQFVDEGFLEMFTFPLKYGNKYSLSNPNAVILDEKTALRYFGKKNPIGKQLTFIFNEKQKESFLVRGVAEELPETASFGFNFLVNYRKQFNLKLIDQNSWQQLTNATFIQLSDPASIHTVVTRMNRYVELQNSADFNRPISNFIFKPLLKMGRNSYKVRDSISGISLTPMHMIPMVMGNLFLLLLACFNYMNIGVVVAARRVKEIGMRKVMGSTRFQLVYQFIGEYILLCLIALLLGIIIAESILHPMLEIAYGDFFSISIFDFISNLNLWLFFIGLLFITGVGAGAYPAFFISSFQPTHIFRGGQTIKGKRIFTRILLTLQFIFSFYACVSGVVLIQNSIHQNNLDWGYSQDHVITIPIDNDYYAAYKNTIEQHPDILSTAGSRMHIGKSNSQVFINNVAAGTMGEAKKYAVVHFDVGLDYVETMGLCIKNGRSFLRTLKTDEDQAVIVNETFVNKMGWKNAIDKRISIENKAYDVIGVIEDFHYQIFNEKIKPVLLRIAPEKMFNYLSIKVKAGKEQQVSEYLQATWRQVIPVTPYGGFYQDEIFNLYLHIMDMTSVISITGSVFFLLITCMGLFGLISLTISKRMKEISIRKVLGASVYNIIRFINKDFIFLLIFASMIALPGSYLLLTYMLDGLIEYNCGVGPLALIFSFVCVIATAMLTVSSLVYRAATSNPSDNLRFE